MSNRQSKAAERKRVLLVDEYMEARFPVSFNLETAGYTLKQVTTAVDALAAMSTFEPDVIIFEWWLRNDAGLGLAERLRRASTKPLVIVVVSTQDEPDGFRTRENVDGYFVKPVKLIDVLRSIARGTTR
jgi:two-component system response regulator MprA